jgi:hypothetical protein
MICCHRYSKLPFQDTGVTKGQRGSRAKNGVGDRATESPAQGFRRWCWVTLLQMGGLFSPILSSIRLILSVRQKESELPNSLLCARMAASLDLVGVFSAQKLK